MQKKLLASVKGEIFERPPIWIMRQAGRYLPEYRETRAKAKGFLDLCYTPELAIEVTLQPLRRFELDAAILFSDILVIPDAVGRQVRFEEGIGPRLEPIGVEEINRLLNEPAKALKHLSPVLEALSGIRQALSDETTLIGFCGAPWTVATYMIGGQGSSDQAAARLFALQHPEAFERLMDVLVDVSAEYLAAQFRAGADVVQIFESWALNLDEHQFRSYVIEPNRRIVDKLRAIIPDAPVIGFPRGAAGMIAEYGTKTGVNMLGLDYAMPLKFARKVVPEGIGVQGNLDPLRLVAGGEQMDRRVDEILEAFKGIPHNFNLGHGIVPQTPIEHVERLVKRVRGEIGS
jgi:uroporphyrinogen decarboxylase